MSGVFNAAGVPTDKGGTYYKTTDGAREGSGELGQGVGQGLAQDDGKTQETDPGSGRAYQRSVPLAFAWTTGRGKQAGMTDYGEH